MLSHCSHVLSGCARVQSGSDAMRCCPIAVAVTLTRDLEAKRCGAVPLHTFAVLLSWHAS
eukprot:6300323-Lingulodinium_polyedra.AAC.1